MSSNEPAPPQYAQPQQVPPQYLPPQPASQPVYQAQSAPRERINAFGVIALILVVIPAFLSAVLPFAMQAVFRYGDSSSWSAISLLFAVTNTILSIAGIVLGICGVQPRQPHRWRWAAIGAIVAGSIGILSIIGSLVGNQLAAVFPY